MTVTTSDLKNIVDEWVNTNSDDILMGLTIKTPNRLLDYERKLLSLVMQLGAMIITWILNRRLQEKSFQKYAKKKIISRKSKRYKHQTDLNTPIRTLFGNTIKPKLRYYIPKGKRGRKC